MTNADTILRNVIHESRRILKALERGADPKSLQSDALNVETMIDEAQDAADFDITSLLFAEAEELAGEVVYRTVSA